MMNSLDEATQSLYQQVAERHRAYIARVNAGVEATHPPRVLLVPGAFHREYPHTGGDGARVRQIAQDLGWPYETLPVPSLDTMRNNARRLADRLDQLHEPTLIVSLSKGTADVRTALATQKWEHVVAWVSLSGMYFGSPLINWLRARPLRCLGVRAILWLRRQRFAALDELRHGQLDEPTALPQHLRIVHVLGFPRQADLSNDWAKRGHARLAPIGPNDGGGVLLTDARKLPGDVYPILGADHYMQPRWDIVPLLKRILLEAAVNR